MNISVLAYHAANIEGNEYHNNDHIALISDLKLFTELGVKIISADTLVSWLNGQIQLDEQVNYVVITFDDGNELDFTDWEHPKYGNQVSFYNALIQSPLKTHATAFVIASPQARETLERTCLGGNHLLGEKWWADAEKTTYMSIENHSWDHLHPTLDNVCQQDNIKENFAKIESFEDAEAQIKQATKYIESVVAKSVSLFAYPYGHYNDYLTKEYFPKQQTHIKAAFTCDPKPVIKDTSIWKIPRYVCGADWKSVAELRKIIS